MQNIFVDVAFLENNRDLGEVSTLNKTHFGVTKSLSVDTANVKKNRILNIGINYE